MSHKRVAKWLAVGILGLFLLGIAGMALDIGARSSALSRGESRLNPDGSSRIFSPVGVGLFLVSACIAVPLMAVFVIVGGLAVFKSGEGEAAKSDPNFPDGASRGRTAPSPKTDVGLMFAASTPFPPPEKAPDAAIKVSPVPDVEEAIEPAGVEPATPARGTAGVSPVPDVEEAIEPAGVEPATPARGTAGPPRPGDRSASDPARKAKQSDRRYEATAKIRANLLLQEPFSLDFDGRARVRTFREDIRRSFDVDLKVHVGFSNGQHADDDATLASIRSESAVKPPMVISVRRGMSVGEFEQAIRDGLGFKVQVMRQGTRAELDQPMMDEAAASRFGLRDASGEVGRVTLSSFVGDRSEAAMLLVHIFGFGLGEAQNLLDAVQRRPVKLPPVRFDAVEWLVLRLRAVGAGVSCEISADGERWQDGEASGRLPAFVRREISFDGRTACRTFREAIAEALGVGLRVHVGFSNGHLAEDGATLASIRSESAGQPTMRMTVWPAMTVKQFEESVRDGFGFKVQVLRHDSRLAGTDTLADMPESMVVGLARRASGKFDVILEHCGAKAIEVIKMIREASGVSLAEAVALVDGAPSLIKSCDPEEAQALLTALRGVGARVSVRPK